MEVSFYKKRKGKTKLIQDEKIQSLEITLKNGKLFDVIFENGLIKIVTSSAMQIIEEDENFLTFKIK